LKATAVDCRKMGQQGVKEFAWGGGCGARGPGGGKQVCRSRPMSNPCRTRGTRDRPKKLRNNYWNRTPGPIPGLTRGVKTGLGKTPPKRAQDEKTG